MANRDISQGTYLAFDFGLKHIGCAIGQNITCTARGLTTLRASNGKPKWHEVNILMQIHKPVGLVVGLPLNMDGSESEMSNLARHFANALSAKTSIPTDLIDERLTTKMAQAELQHAQASGHKYSTHELAACYILESWFNES